MCIALLPLVMLRDYTPSNELRYLSIADEAMRNHTFFTFYNHGEVYADKPPLYFWALMLCKWLVGGYKMWMLALFSLLPAIGILRVMDHWVREEMDGEHRSLAMLMLLSSGLHTLWLLYDNKQHTAIPQAIGHLGMGLLLAVFLGGWAMPTLNSEICYGTICEKASDIATQRNITDFRTWHIVRSSNIDVYVHHQPTIISGDSLPTREPGKSYLLITERIPATATGVYPDLGGRQICHCNI